MKRIAAVLLTLITVLSLTACSLINRPSLEGTWECSLDCTSLFLSNIDSLPDADSTSGARAELPFLLTVNQDGTFSVELDRDALPEALRLSVRTSWVLCNEAFNRTAKEAGVSRFAFEVMFFMKQGMSTDAYMLQAISGDLLETIYQGAQKQGMGRGAYDVYTLSRFGTTPERYVQQFSTTGELIDGLNTEWILEILSEGLSLDELDLSVCAGYFRAEEKKLYITLNGGDQPQELPFGYTLEDGVMTWRIDETGLAGLVEDSGAAMEDVKAYLEKMGLWSMVWTRR